MHLRRSTLHALLTRYARMYRTGFAAMVAAVRAHPAMRGVFVLFYEQELRNASHFVGTRLIHDYLGLRGAHRTDLPSGHLAHKLLKPGLQNIVGNADAVRGWLARDWGARSVRMTRAHYSLREFDARAELDALLDDAGVTSNRERKKFILA